MKPHNQAREKAFENELRHVAAMHGCLYVKIPDPIVTANKVRDRKNYMFTEEKRPFDGVLVTPLGNYCIECKYSYNTLAEHQKQNLDHINDMTCWSRADAADFLLRISAAMLKPVLDQEGQEAEPPLMDPGKIILSHLGSI